MSVYLGTNLLAGTPDITGKANTSLNNLDSTGQAVIDGKVDLNLNNMNPSATAKETIVGWGMPDYSAGVSLGEPSTYQTIPVDSFVRWSRDNTGTVSSAGIYVASPDESIELDFRVTTNYWCNMGVPVPAGWKVKGYAGGETITYYPMKGVPNS